MKYTKAAGAVLAVIMAFTCLTGCGASGNGSSSADNSSAACAQTADTGANEADQTAKTDADEADLNGSGDEAGSENTAKAGEEGEAEESSKSGEESSLSDTENEIQDNEEEKSEPIPVPEGMYLSELTGEPVNEELKMQRPVAVMVDNEREALPHFGTAGADVVYEMVNSLANDRITRLMCIYKDWDSVPKIGSIRSTRPTNVLLAQEWDAVICHDGGPYYIYDYLSRYNYHFSGTFSRVNNGKAREFTEYILKGDLDRNFRNSGYSTEYSEEPVSHFKFTEYGTKTDMEAMSTKDVVRPANTVKLPFYHNRSELHYNKEAHKYEYYEYGSKHLDAETKEPMQFENVILQKVDVHQLDSNGYLIYNCIGYNLGYYITEGKLISILWQKDGESGITHFYDADKNEITINTGKTYIGLIPSESFTDELEIY